MRTVILYHRGCYDGFGGAYAAWKKFGDSALYIPCEASNPVPPEASGAIVYLIDVCPQEEQLQELLARAKSVVVIDHHEGNRELIAPHSSWRFATDRSGCGLAWEYFHPETPVPLFLKYVEEGDLWRYTLPQSQALRIWIHTLPLRFEAWDAICSEFTSEDAVNKYAEKARAYREYYNWVVDLYAQRAEPVLFEGHEVLAVYAPDFIRSDLGSRLAEKKPPFGIVLRTSFDGTHVSLRARDQLSVIPLAQKYGGGGHPNAAGFFIPHNLPLPFTRGDSRTASPDDQ